MQTCQQVVWFGVALMLHGCLEEVQDDARSTSGRWTGWFSEEHGGLSELLSGPMYAVGCRGNYCDDKRLRQGDGRGFVKDAGKLTHWFSDKGKGGGSGLCDAGLAVTQMRCKGKYCDNLQLRCQLPDENWVVDNIGDTWTGWFSDGKNGEGACNDAIVTGVKCKGKYCDNLQLRCSKAKPKPTIITFEEVPRITFEEVPHWDCDDGSVDEITEPEKDACFKNFEQRVDCPVVTWVKWNAMLFNGHKNCKCKPECTKGYFSFGSVSYFKEAENAMYGFKKHEDLECNGDTMMTKSTSSENECLNQWEKYPCPIITWSKAKSECLCKSACKNAGLAGNHTNHTSWIGNNAWVDTKRNDGSAYCSAYCAHNWHNELPSNWLGSCCMGATRPDGTIVSCHQFSPRPGHSCRCARDDGRPFLEKVTTGNWEKSRYNKDHVCEAFS